MAIAKNLIAHETYMQFKCPHAGVSPTIPRYPFQYLFIGTAYLLHYEILQTSH